jgi:cbb3-type cytochrome oxidase maturation protein
MSVVLLLIVAGGLVAGGFLCAFAWAVRSGQYDDVTTPAVRILGEAPLTHHDSPAREGRITQRGR